MAQRVLSGLVFASTVLVGAVAFLYPFWQPALQQTQNRGQAHAEDAALMLTLLVGLSFLVLLLEVQSQAISAKSVALLGVLVAINTVLRFVEVAIPAPGGFSPIFFLVILAGYVYGGRFGFLLGAMTMLVSSLVTGALGPWLPYQMFTAGWIGLSAPLCQPVVRAVRGQGRWREVLILAIFGGIWGLLFGVIINIFFWPFIVGPSNQYWEPGTGLFEAIQRYALFYLATSALWDSVRLVGNTLLILAFGRPTLAALRRFHQRFTFTYTPRMAVGAHASVQNRTSAR